MSDTLPIVPPQWEQRLLQAWLPDDPMRDAVIGDLHEEFVRDVRGVGALRARVRYRQRVAGIAAYMVFDTVRLRSWASVSAPGASAAMALPPVVVARKGRGLLGRADVGLIAAAFGVLGLGIIANTLLFSVVRPSAHQLPAGHVASSAIGAVSLVLALGSAAVAALMLCVGPRWLRRRACRQASVSQTAPH